MSHVLELSLWRNDCILNCFIGFSPLSHLFVVFVLCETLSIMFCVENLCSLEERHMGCLIVSGEVRYTASVVLKCLWSFFGRKQV